MAQWNILDEVDDEEDADTPALVLTGQSLRCGGAIHSVTRTVALFMGDAMQSWNDVLIAAVEAGWRSDDEHHIWLCPACAETATMTNEEQA